MCVQVTLRAVCNRIFIRVTYIRRRKNHKFRRAAARTAKHGNVSQLAFVLPIAEFGRAARQTQYIRLRPQHEWNDTAARLFLVTLRYRNFCMFSVFDAEELCNSGVNARALSWVCSSPEPSGDSTSPRIYACSRLIFLLFLFTSVTKY